MKQKNNFFPTAAFFIALAVAYYVGRDYKSIIDSFRLYNYHPPPAIEELARDGHFSAYGRRLFYASHPQIVSGKMVNGSCHGDESSVVLGCYSFRSGIALYEVRDVRLRDVMKVTAAHEMLHAAYLRLHDSDRQRIDRLTGEAFQHVTAKSILDKMLIYTKQDPLVISNELHSILGSEVAELPLELETYYAQYFSDRKKLVHFARAYDEEFSRRDGQIKEYDQALEKMKKEIETRRALINESNQELTAAKRRMDDFKSLGQIDRFNAAVPKFNAWVSDNQKRVDDFNKMILEYQNLVTKRNSIVIETQGLSQIMDSRL